MIDDNRLYSLTEAAAIAGVCMASVYNYLRDGCGPVTVRVGKRRFVRGSALRQWIGG